MVNLIFNHVIEFKHVHHTNGRIVIVTVTRATIYFEGGMFTRTKSRHVIATIGALADDPISIDGGFAVVINKKVKFGKEPTLYANGKIYDVLTMTIGEE